jgi:hypothetical protein
MNVIRSIGLFAAAGLAEIGGGYLIWRWLREGAPWPVGLLGRLILGLLPAVGLGHRRPPPRHLLLARRGDRDRRTSALLLPAAGRSPFQGSPGKKRSGVTAGSPVALAACT